MLRQVTFSIADKPEITTHPQNVTATEGNIATLYCNATGNPPPLISWNKDGFPIGNNSRISFSAGQKQLKITNVNRRDSGDYQCAAINDIGNDTSTAATLNVQCKYGGILYMYTITIVDDILKYTIQTVLLSKLLRSEIITVRI